MSRKYPGLQYVFRVVKSIISVYVYVSYPHRQLYVFPTHVSVCVCGDCPPPFRRRFDTTMAVFLLNPTPPQCIRFLICSRNFICSPPHFNTYKRRLIIKFVQFYKTFMMSVLMIHHPSSFFFLCIDFLCKTNSCFLFCLFSSSIWEGFLETTRRSEFQNFNPIPRLCSTSWNIVIIYVMHVQ